MKPHSSESIGVITGLIAAALWGLWPVLTHRASQSLPPIFFLSIVTGIATTVAFGYAAASGKLPEFKKRQAYASILMVTLCVIVIPPTLLAIGSTKTSGLNTSMLMLVEIIYTAIFTHFIGERTTLLKLLGVGCIFFGAAFLVYKGNFSINSGDLIILLSPLTYPVGNFYSKKALNHVSTATILTARLFFGTFFLFALSRIFEPHVPLSALTAENWLIIGIVGLVVLGIGRIIAYESLNRLDISKFLAIAMTFPLFSVLVLTLVFQEPLSVRQSIGITIMMAGVYFSIKRPSVDPARTKYARPSH